MSCWVIIPVKPPGEGKLRLAAVLDAEARNALVHGMLAHVFDAVSAARNVDRICLLGPSRHGLPSDLPLLADPGGGLNAALTSALCEAATAGATRAVIVAADLPRLTPRDVELLAGAPAGAMAIAPDRHRTGTNALSLPLPEAKGFTFAYGPGSFAGHDAEAFRLKLDIEVIESAGLARDVDLPEDLRALKGKWGAGVWGE